MASYYIALLLGEQEKREREQRELSDANLRAARRRMITPMDITESEFIKRYRLSKSAFKFICHEIRTKTNLKENRISIELKVICALSYYATGSYQRIVYMGKYFGPITVKKFTTEVTEALNNPRIANNLIRFPATRAERDIVKRKFFNEYRIPGVIGVVGRSYFRIETPKNEIKHLFFNDKNNISSLNAHVVCDSDGRILNMEIKYGATNYAIIWENSVVNRHMQALHRNNELVWLLGDSVYPQKPWLMTPITNPVKGSLEDKYTTLHAKAISSAETTLGKLKKKWQCLNKDSILNYPPESCIKIIIACCALHNLAIQFGVPDVECDFQDKIESISSEGDVKIDLYGLATRRTLVDLIGSF